MAKITFFFLAILALTISLALYKFDFDVKNNKQNDFATLIFEDAIMYKIDKENLKSIIKAKKAIQYKSKKLIIYDGVFYLRNKAKTSLINAKFILKNKDIINFNQNVNYVDSDNFTFDTKNLIYDTKRKLLYNDTYFLATQNNNSFKGKNIFIDKNRDLIKAKEVEIVYKD